MNLNKIFVIADERCGGTQLHNMFKIAGYVSIDDPQTYIKDKKGRDIKINNKEFVLNNFDYFANNYNYIKICMSSFTLEEYQKIILMAKAKDYKFIFLWRKNYLERALSKAIAVKTNVWSQFTINEEWENKFELNEQLIQNDLNRNKKMVHNLKKFVKSKNILFYNLLYEHLYLYTDDVEKRYVVLKKIFSYIDKNINKNLDNNKIIKIKERLAPTQKINSIISYRRITNIVSILNKFSNKSNGIVKI
jgi:hypothetical protein